MSERQLVILEEFRRSRTEPLWVVKRAGVIGLAWAGRFHREMAQEVQLDRRAAGTWRRRWRAAGNDLTLLECVEPARLREAIRETLQDAPRPGRPGTFPAEHVTQIGAVACAPPEKSGRPITHWTNAELRDDVVKRKIVPRLSVAQVGHYLRTAALQPPRRTMWLTTTEKDPVTFERQVAEVCETYQTAGPRHEADGTRTVCVAEMPGRPALERAAPDKPARAGQVAKQEFEYVRHGTTTLIGNGDLVQGTLFAETIGPTRTEPDFVAHLEQTGARDPDVPWVFVVEGLVVEGLNVQWSATLVEWIAKRCEPDRPLGKKRALGRAALPSDSPRISV